MFSNNILYPVSKYVRSTYTQLFLFISFKISQQFIVKLGISLKSLVLVTIWSEFCSVPFSITSLILFRYLFSYLKILTYSHRNS